MFDTLTRDELYVLHHSLAAEGVEVHERVMALPPLDAEGLVLMAKHREIGETMHAVFMEISRREQERLIDTWMICAACRKEIKRTETGAWHHVTWNRCSAVIEPMVATDV